MLEETGVDYEQMPMNMREGEHKSPEFLKLNPNGKVPVLIDGDLVLWESMAITQYLADKYKPELICQTPEGRALSQKWSFWSILELQPPLVDLLIQTMFVPEERRDLDKIEKAKALVPAKLKILDQHLKNSPYIAGDYFTVADINAASTAVICNHVKIDLKPYPNICAWLQKIEQRPGYQKYLGVCDPKR